MLESEVESHFRNQVKKLKGLCLKLTILGFTGMPDRMVLMPGGKMGFVEVKRPGAKPRKRQKFVIKLLRDLGFKVFVLDCKEGVKLILDEIQAV